jgi:hypothetical protein
MIRAIWTSTAKNGYRAKIMVGQWSSDSEKTVWPPVWSPRQEDAVKGEGGGDEKPNHRSEREMWCNAKAPYARTNPKSHSIEEGRKKSKTRSSIKARCNAVDGRRFAQPAGTIKKRMKKSPAPCVAPMGCGHKRQALNGE